MLLIITLVIQLRAKNTSRSLFFSESKPCFFSDSPKLLQQATSLPSQALQTDTECWHRALVSALSDSQFQNGSSAGAESNLRNPGGILQIRLRRKIRTDASQNNHGPFAQMPEHYRHHLNKA